MGPNFSSYVAAFGILCTSIELSTGFFLVPGRNLPIYIGLLMKVSLFLSREETSA